MGNLDERSDSAGESDQYNADEEEGLIDYNMPNYAEESQLPPIRTKQRRPF